MPIVTLVDTPGRLSRARRRGARPGRGDRASTCARWRALGVPIVTVVIGEGGSGGALAIAVADVRAHVRELDLLGDLARGLRLDPVARRQEERAGRRGAASSPPPTCSSSGDRRRGAARAAGRRAPRPGGGRGDAQGRASAAPGRAVRGIRTELVERRLQRFRRMGVFQRGARLDPCENAVARLQLAFTTGEGLRSALRRSAHDPAPDVLEPPRNPMALSPDLLASWCARRARAT